MRQWVILARELLAARASQLVPVFTIEIDQVATDLHAQVLDCICITSCSGAIIPHLRAIRPSLDTCVWPCIWPCNCR
jgi:hypothetical protein